jgi:hypothetical protein
MVDQTKDLGVSVYLFYGIGGLLMIQVLAFVRVPKRTEKPAFCNFLGLKSTSYLKNAYPVTSFIIPDAIDINSVAFSRHTSSCLVFYATGILDLQVGNRGTRKNKNQKLLDAFGPIVNTLATVPKLRKEQLTQDSGSGKSINIQTYNIIYKCTCTKEVRGLRGIRTLGKVNVLLVKHLQ